MPAEAQFWNDIADKYSRQPVGDPEAFERKIAITKSRMSPSDVVIDIGCGTGSLALRLAPFAAQVHGLDVSTEMVRIANDKAAEAQASNVTFHVGALDASFDALPPGSLDGVCAYSLLHLVDDLPDALARIFALLRPGGFFISSTVCLGDSWIPYRPLLAVMRWLGKAPPVQILARDRLLEEVRAAGFVDVSLPDVGASSTIAFMVATKP